MTRQELTDYIFDTYRVEPDFPFQRENIAALLAMSYGMTASKIRRRK